MSIAKNDGNVDISVEKKKIHHFIAVFKERRGSGQEGKACVYRRMPLDNVNRMLETYNHQFVTPNVIIDSSQDC